MIDTDKYERTTPELEEFEGENLGDLITNLLTEVLRLREAILEFADYLEEKVTPYMTNDIHEVVPIGGMVSDLHKMIKGDE
jgi:hypothetical protein